MFVPAQNVTDTQVVIDADGRTLGGGEWGAVDRHDPHAAQAIGESRLVIHPDLAVAADTDDDARVAHEAAGRLEARRLELANLDGDQLAALAIAAGLDVAPVETVDELDAVRRTLVHVDPSRSTAVTGDASPVDDDDDGGDTVVVPARHPEAEPDAGPPAIPAADKSKARGAK